MEKNKKKTPITFFHSRFVAVISITLVLYLMGLFLLVGLLSNDLSIFMKENIAFSIILRENVKITDVTSMQKKLNALPYIKTAKYISKEEAMEEMIKELGDDPTNFLGYNPFQPSIEVKLHSHYTNADSLKMIERQLASYTNVSEMIYQKEIMQMVNDNIKRIGLTLLVIIIVLSLISFALISNTVRLMIYSKRFLIYTMRLVGATPHFIRMPYIRSSIISGFIAGLLAIMMLIGTLTYLKQAWSGLDHVIQQEKLIMIYGAVLILGIFLSALSAFFAVNRYIWMKRGNLYYA